MQYEVNGASPWRLESWAAWAEIWLDDYSHVVFQEDGTFSVTYGNPPVDQPRAMDLTNLVIKLADTDD